MKLRYKTAVDAIDRLRDTSSSHQRISIVEIMGRHCSDLTISAGIAGGCEYIVASEMEFNREELIRQIERSIIRGKRHAIIAITELITDVHSLAREIEARVGHETRATVLGHIQTWWFTLCLRPYFSFTYGRICGRYIATR